MSICYIFSAAPIDNYDYIKIKKEKDDFIICADGGIEHIINLKLNPDLILGDFDSFFGEIPFNCEIIKLKAEKDETDTLYAVKKAFELGYKNIVIYGGLGARLDHTIANIQTIAFGINNDVQVKLIDEKTTVFVLKNSQFIGKPEQNARISIFSLTEKSFGVTLKGLKYELEQEELNFDFPIGTSNEFLDKEFEISVEKGTLLIIISKI